MTTTAPIRRFRLSIGPRSSSAQARFGRGRFGSDMAESSDRIEPSDDIDECSSDRRT
jgi:hypothetical protein